MKGDLSPKAVADRLASLRASCTPLTREEALDRLAPPRISEPLAQSAARRLEELRALYDLTLYLRRARPR